MLAITDTHQHLWDRTRLNLPWLQGSTVLNRDYKLPDYLHATRGSGIHRSIYVEVDVLPEQRALELELAAELCDKPNLPLCAIVAAADPLSSDFEHQLTRLLAVPYVRGVRRVLHTDATPKGHCLRPEFVAGVRRLGDVGLCFDLCVRNTEMEDAAGLVELCPGTQFIVDHCGNADPVGVERWKQLGAVSNDASTSGSWARGMQRLAAAPNTACKLSGIVASLPTHVPLEWLAATLDLCLEWFGTERVMFGSDWPVCTLRTELADWLRVAQAVVSSRSEPEQRRIFDQNAARVYRLE